VGGVASFTVLGIDEIALKKGYRDYVVIITARLSQGASWFSPPCQIGPRRRWSRG